MSNVWIIYDTHKFEYFVSSRICRILPSLSFSPISSHANRSRIPPRPTDAKLLPKSEKQVMLGEVWASPPLSKYGDRKSNFLAFLLYLYMSQQGGQTFTSGISLSALFSLVGWDSPFIPSYWILIYLTSLIFDFNLHSHNGY